MSGLALWYRKRLRSLARGPRSYGAFDTVNAALSRQGLIVQTSRIVGPNRREYAITDEGHIALGSACEAQTRAASECPRPVARPRRLGAAREACV